MRVLMRVEAGGRVGLGHVMRCLSLSAALRQCGASVSFLTDSFTGNVIRRASSEYAVFPIPHGLPEISDAARTVALLARCPFDWVVVDHYSLGLLWEDAVVASGAELLAIDDLARPHVAGSVLDSSPEAICRYGALAVGCYTLFGPAYALLRPGFCLLRQSAAARDKNRLFISFGGADPDDMTGWVVDTLRNSPYQAWAADIVVGRSYRHMASLKARVGKASGWMIYHDVIAPERLMARASLAIGAGGAMTWERCALGLPTVVISIADNQHNMSASLHERGVLHYAGHAGHVGADELLQALAWCEKNSDAMRRRARAYIDGKGAQRVARFMTATRSLAK